MHAKFQPSSFKTVGGDRGDRQTDTGHHAVLLGSLYKFQNCPSASLVRDKISHSTMSRHGHRLRLPAQAAGKICTIVILGLATAESLQIRLGQLLVNLYKKPKLIFMTLLPLNIRSLCI